MSRAPLWFLLVVISLSSAPLAAEPLPGVYVILDGSGSMWGQLADGSHKITAAREVVAGFSAADYAGREMAFRVYGHRREGDCSDSELVVPFSLPESAIAQMSAFADQVNPKGKTPISRSLRAALEDFGDRPGEIVLISDGIETCDEDPCALVRDWRARDIDIRLHVVGLGLQAKEQAAMRCISEAAGTEYLDAQSAAELAAGLQQIRAAATAADAADRSAWRALDIVATSPAGDSLRVQGSAKWAGAEPVAVSSNGHNLVPAGEVEVTVGVRTWNGSLYQPVTRTVRVAERGRSILEVVVPEPPSVEARFVELGQEHGGAFVKGFQDGEEVLGFRAQDRAYVEPGTYEFRSRPNADNELVVRETFAAGDHKEIVFEMVPTVLARFKLIAAGSGISFNTNFELWQDGEQKYSVHQRNGVRALPGTYELRMPLQLTPYSHPGVVLTAEPEQDFEIEVPVGHLTIRYQDAQGTAITAKRCFLARKNEAGKWVRDRNAQSDQRIPLVAGDYRVEGWSQLGDFEPVEFEMSVGEEKEIILRAQGDR